MAVQVGDMIAVVIGERGVIIRAAKITEDPKRGPCVEWESTTTADEGITPVNIWEQAAKSQAIMRESGLLGSGQSLDAVKLRETLKLIGQCCAEVGRLESLRMQFSTKIIHNAAGDMRRIQQLVYEATGFIADEKQ